MGLRGAIEQKPRLGYGPQPTPGRYAYIEAARGHHPTRHAWQLTHDEVRQIRAMFQSDAVLYTIAAHFSIPRKEVGKVARRPFLLRAEVPAAFETPTQKELRERWFRDEVEEAHAEAWQGQLEKDWTEAKREDRQRKKAAANDTHWATKRSVVSACGWSQEAVPFTTKPGEVSCHRCARLIEVGTAS